MLFNILNDKPAKFSKWRECKFSTPAEFKNQLYNFDMGSLSVETLLMVKENTEMDWFSYDECSNYYTLCGFFVMWIQAIATNYDAIARMIQEKRKLDISKESGKLNKWVLIKNGPASAWNSIKPEIRFK